MPAYLTREYKKRYRDLYYKITGITLPTPPREAAVHYVNTLYDHVQASGLYYPLVMKLGKNATWAAIVGRLRGLGRAMGRVN